MSDDINEDSINSWAVAIQKAVQDVCQKEQAAEAAREYLEALKSGARDAVKERGLWNVLQSGK